MEADRDPVGAEEDADDREPGQVAAELGQDEAGEDAPRRAQDRSAVDELLSQFRQSLPEDPRQQDEEDDRADRRAGATSPTWSARKPSLIEKEPLTVRKR